MSDTLECSSHAALIFKIVDYPPQTHEPAPGGSTRVTGLAETVIYGRQADFQGQEGRAQGWREKGCSRCEERIPIATRHRKCDLHVVHRVFDDIICPSVRKAAAQPRPRSGPNPPSSLRGGSEHTVASVLGRNQFIDSCFSMSVALTPLSGMMCMLSAPGRVFEGGTCGVASTGDSNGLFRGIFEDSP